MPFNNYSPLSGTEKRGSNHSINTQLLAYLSEKHTDIFLQKREFLVY